MGFTPQKRELEIQDKTPLTMPLSLSERLQKAAERACISKQEMIRQMIAHCLEEVES